MTENTADAIRAALTENGHALAQAREDAAVFDRLRLAASEVTRLQKVGDELTAALSKALANEDTASVKAVAQSYRSFTITATPGHGEDNVTPMHARIVIAYERLRYDMGARTNVWTAEQVTDFRQLDGLVLRYIIRHKPELIPPVIMSLAPGDPEKALDRYLIGLQRNYV